MNQDEVNWNPKSSKDLPDWAHSQTPEESDAFTRWLRKRDGNPYEPTDRDVLLYWAKVRGIEVPPWRPEPATLPGMLSEAFEVKGTINIGSGYYLWWLVSKNNYEPEDAKHLIEDSGLEISDGSLKLMTGFIDNIINRESRKEVKSFQEFLNEGLLPVGSLVFAVHRVI